MFEKKDRRSNWKSSKTNCWRMCWFVWQYTRLPFFCYFYSWGSWMGFRTICKRNVRSMWQVAGRWCGRWHRDACRISDLRKYWNIVHITKARVHSLHITKARVHLFEWMELEIFFWCVNHLPYRKPRLRLRVTSESVPFFKYNRNLLSPGKKGLKK